jgi:hypothetical protein
MIDALITDHPNITFKRSRYFMWSPTTNTVHYRHQPRDEEIWSLLHELGHALLSHTSFDSDLELLKHERAAWDKAQQIADKYNITISIDHIESSLDTYRDWLYQRSRCPECGQASVQIKTRQYSCFNCLCQWKVPASQACQVKRFKI